MQEWWGVNDQMKAFAERMALAGFRSVVPDFFRGKVYFKLQFQRPFVVPHLHSIHTSVVHTIFFFSLRWPNDQKKQVILQIN